MLSFPARSGDKSKDVESVITQSERVFREGCGTKPKDSRHILFVSLLFRMKPLFFSQKNCENDPADSRCRPTEEEENVQLKGTSIDLSII